jgi:hypothetical protein
MPKKVRVHVYEADGEFRVQPPLIELDAAAGGDDVEMVNHTGEDLIWYVDADVLSNNAEAFAVGKSGGKSGNKKPKSKGPGVTRLVTYQVFMVQSAKKAKGNSDPVIIIDN